MIVASVTRTKQRATKRRSATLRSSSSERAPSDSFKAAARNASHNSIRPLRSSLPMFRETSSESRETSRICRCFVASLKLCLGLRIAAGRTSGRAWDFSWQFVSELPGKKESSAVEWARVTSFPSDIHSRFPPRTMRLAHDDQHDQCNLRRNDCAVDQGICCRCLFRIFRGYLEMV